VNGYVGAVHGLLGGFSIGETHLLVYDDVLADLELWARAAWEPLQVPKE
jgi:hypothetical protein